MATKNNPGEFDCYAKAEPDEPHFVLLARDPLAPLLVRAWARKYAERKGVDPSPIATHEQDKFNEALDCADAMERWSRARDRLGVE